MDLKKWSPWTQLIQKCTRRLQMLPRHSDGPMDFSHLEQEVEVPLHSQEGHQGQAHQISQERTCRYLNLHRTEWMAPAIQDQPLVPQA